ncbi:MAG: FxsA family protein [Pseudomonadota bacterium]|nr:FxsA family protein [Pseudomonadota bacterium]
MILLILAALVLGPLIELFLLIKAGAAFGAIPVIAYCIATAVIGGFILRLQGMAALASARKDMHDGKVPVEAAVDGVFLALAAPLLMTPGIVTDIIGFILLAPAARHAMARAVLSRLRAKMETGEARVYIQRF